MASIRIKKPGTTAMIYIAIYLAFNVLCLFQHISFGSGTLLMTVVLVGLGGLLPYEELGVYLFTALPFFNVMNMTMGTTSLYYLLLGIVVVRYFLCGFDATTPVKLMILCIIIAVTCYNFSATNRYLQWFIRVIPLVLFFRASIIRDYLKDIVEKYAISMFFSSCWGWVMLRAGTSIYTQSYVYSDTGSTTRFAGLVGDSVLYGTQLLLLISFLTILLFKSKSSNPLWVALIIAFSWFGAMTYSRTFFIFGFAIFLFCYFYWSHNTVTTRQEIIKRICVFLAYIAVVAAFLFFLMMSQSEWAATARLRLIESDISASRTNVWSFYLDWCLNNWFALFRGMGFGEYVIRRTFYSGVFGAYEVMYAHSLFLETVAMFGVLVSLALFALLVYWLVKTFRRHRDILLFLPMLILLGTGIFVHGHFEYGFYMNVLLILMVGENTTVAADREMKRDGRKLGKWDEKTA